MKGIFNQRLFRLLLYRKMFFFKNKQIIKSKNFAGFSSCSSVKKKYLNSPAMVVFTYIFGGLYMLSRCTVICNYFIQT